MKATMFISIFLASLLLGNYSLGQTKVTKSKISKLIESSIPTTDEGIHTLFRSWTICNQDSAFFKSDTIRLYNNFNYFHQISSCCTFISWFFYGKDSFLQERSQVCNEPPTAETHKDYYKFGITKERGKLYFQANKSNLLAAQFEIIRIENIKLADDNYTNVIVLKRK